MSQTTNSSRTSSESFVIVDTQSNSSSNPEITEKKMPREFIVGKPSKKQGEHHESINALWNLKWKKRVRDSAQIKRLW
jgi:hypothetical protein